ncbi:MAG: YceD family protein [Thiohalobacteraceae bacterium]
MRDRLPDTIDTASLKTLGREYRGALAVATMARLVEALRDTAVPDLEVSLQVERDAGGVRCVRGHIDGILHLTCQRCLERLEFPVRIDFKSALVRSEVEAERLAEGYDPLLIEDDRLVVRDLIEDELLLALPGFPQHREASCALPEYRAESPAESADARPNPFAILADLKRK